jgi:hypothetical protein
MSEFRSHELFPRGSGRDRTRRVAAALAALAALAAGRAEAKPGTHAPSISTWDTRASSVVPAFSAGFLDGGHLHFASYNANFTSTSGNLSSQFGMHYAQLRESPDESSLHGLAGGAVALFSIPISQRFDNGIPKLALAMYIGAVPTVLISGKFNYLEVPVVAGLGLPVSPVRQITFTPWFELAPSFNLDTVVNPYSFDRAVAENPSQFVDPQTGQVNLTQKDVQRIVSDAVDVQPSGAFNVRGGLALAAHLGDAVDFNLGGTFGSLGSAFSGTTVFWLTTGFTFRWDDIVPAVLPPEKRLLKESCDAVEERFRTCPAYRRMLDEPRPGPRPLQPAPASAAPPAAAPAAAAPPAPAAPPAGGLRPDALLASGPCPPSP